MANRIYHAFWLLFLYIVWLFLLSVRTERPTDSYHTFLELTSSGSIVHFDHREARKGVLSFSCALPGDRWNGPSWQSAARSVPSPGGRPGDPGPRRTVRFLRSVPIPGF